MVIPSINCPNFAAAKEQIEKAREFLREGGWIHIDVSDGKFTETKSWGNPEELRSLGTTFNVEVHLMVEEPEAVVGSWLRAGARRVIVHVQAMRDPGGLLALAKRYNAEVMLALDPTQSTEAARPFLKDFTYLQVLSVFPGPSGQTFQEEAIHKIRALREASPTATIEVDGGVDGENAGRIKEAGADILVSGHYIFGSPDPKGAYEELKRA